MATQVDLRQLAVERTPASISSLPRSRAWWSRWGLPAAIVCAFAAIVGWTARDFLLPAKPVTVVPVFLAKAELQQAGTPLFQAAGWIEPRPTAVMATALVEGVVSELLVVEGQDVTADQPMARLVDADAKLAVRDAEATLKLREAERDATKAAVAATERHLQQPAHLEAALAESDAALAQVDTEIANLPFTLRVAESREQLARQDLEGKKSVANNIAGRLLQKSQSEFDAAVAAVEELRQRGPKLDAQREACRRKSAALRSRLELKTDERRALDEATANLAAAQAKVTQAQVAVESAHLRLERMTIRAPVAGRILALVTQPGRRLMGLEAAAQHDSSTVATLYDPRKLQVRADVRLEDVPQVQIGQPVQIVTAAHNQTLTGRVLAATSLADNQKNTLSVKVAIDDPPPAIRPEMLAKVTFLTPETPGNKSEGGEEPMRLLVARQLVETGEAGTSVWVADSARGVARRQVVQLGRAGTEQLVEVTTGLTAMDKLIAGGREGLKDGTRIRVSGEDPSIGTSTGTRK